MEYIIAAILFCGLVWLVAVASSSNSKATNTTKDVISDSPIYEMPRRALFGEHKEMKWKREFGKGKLEGELIELSDGSLQMIVYDYVTSRELRENYNLTPRLIKMFFSEPDEIAVFEDYGG